MVNSIKEGYEHYDTKLVKYPKEGILNFDSDQKNESHQGFGQLSC